MNRSLFVSVSVWCCDEQSKHLSSDTSSQTDIKASCLLTLAFWRLIGLKREVYISLLGDPKQELKWNFLSDKHPPRRDSSFLPALTVWHLFGHSNETKKIPQFFFFLSIFLLFYFSFLFSIPLFIWLSVRFPWRRAEGNRVTTSQTTASSHHQQVEVRKKSRTRSFILVYG